MRVEALSNLVIHVSDHVLHLGLRYHSFHTALWCPGCFSTSITMWFVYDGKVLLWSLFHVTFYLYNKQFLVAVSSCMGYWFHLDNNQECYVVMYIICIYYIATVCTYVYVLDVLILDTWHGQLCDQVLLIEVLLIDCNKRVVSVRICFF